MKSVNQLSAHCVSGFLLSFLTRSLWFSISSSQQHNKKNAKNAVPLQRAFFFKKKGKKEGCMRSQMQKAACEAKCSFSGTRKKG